MAKGGTLIAFLSERVFSFLFLLFWKMAKTLIYSTLTIQNY